MNNPSPRISQVEISIFEIRVPDIATDPAGLGVFYQPGADIAQKRLAIRIRTACGLVGEYVPPRGRAEVIMPALIAMAYQLIGQPALERERLYLRMRRASHYIGESGIGPLDIALWDLAGKQQGLSIGTLLGGYRDRLPAYASTNYGDAHADGLSSPEAYRDFAEACLERGYKAYKIHGFTSGDVDREIAILRCVGERMSGRMEIMYDAACRLPTLLSAIKVGKVCDEQGLVWFEDPYADGGLSISAHRKLKEHVRTPIMITENIRNPESQLDVLVAGASDFARVDPDYDGGITGSMKVATAAQSLGLDVEVHSCGPAMRQVVSALRNANYYELNLLHPRLPNAWTLPVYADGYSDDVDCIGVDGCVPVPKGPGLGVTYDWDAIDRTTLEKREIVLDGET